MSDKTVVPENDVFLKRIKEKSDQLREDFERGYANYLDKAASDNILPVAKEDALNSFLIDLVATIMVQNEDLVKEVAGHDKCIECMCDKKAL